jgi:hypothetical protein
MLDHPPGAALALAAAILALPLAALPFLGGPLAVAALALATWSRKRMRAAPERFRDSGLTTAASVCALVAIGLAALMLPFWLAVAGALAAHAAHAPAEPPLLY